MSEVCLPQSLSLLETKLASMSQKRNMPDPVFKISRVERPDPTQESTTPFEKASGNCLCGTYNRKEKSLGQLCKKFLNLYGGEANCLISLDACTQRLGVERRRLYDIINILESFSAVTRKAKNLYEWKGLESIGQSISTMEFAKAQIVSPPHSPATPIVRQSQDDEDDKSESGEGSLRTPTTATHGKKKREKSLGQLCVQFIQLFVQKCPELSLEQAASMLSTSLSPEYHKIKTKIRRLYDIANVLQALNLIEKTSLLNRKPGFKWLGHRGFLAFVEVQRRKMEKYALEESENLPEEMKELKKVKTEQRVFVVSKGLPLTIRRVVEPVAPRVKHFKPRVLQVSSPIPTMSQPEKKRIKLEFTTDKSQPGSAEKENVSVLNPQMMFENPGAFTKLNLLLQVVSKMEGKVQTKNLRRRALMESQAINLVP